jgi:hypothetical protein
MELTLTYKILVALTAIIGGHVILGLFISVMYHQLKIDPPKGRWQGFGLLVFFVGATEQLAAILLIGFAPKYVASFIGGWTGLKYASNWQPKDAPFARSKSLLALIGTVWSFTFGVVAGCIINPEALNYFRLAAYGH